MKISEQFYSIQGEGVHVGTPSYFIRLFGCSLQCQGFGQANPADETTWKQPWKTINIENITRIEDLPAEIYEYGCDSVYSWSAKFKGIQKEMTADEVVEKIKSDLGEALFRKLLVGDIHIVFTGGEPLMKFNQQAIADILDVLCKDSVLYPSVTIETNGTQEIGDQLKARLKQTNLTIACSPKLLHTSGEQRSKAIKPHIIRQLESIADTAVLKFVVANTAEAKQEFLEVVNSVAGETHHIYVMPEGPNKHRVEDSSAELAEFAMAHGYRFSDRLHARLWDNKIGV